jgi:PAS domain S-box-containing protein
MDKDHIRILLIEDDEDDYALVRELLSGLSRADFSLEWVKTYQEGLKELCRGDHDVYLLDYRLGSRDGLELIREAAGSGCDKPIIFLTGSGDYEVDTGAMRSGVADYIVKAQLSDDMLERSIRYSIARKKSERELKIYRDRLEDLVKERTEQLETANEKLRLEIAERTLAEEALRESEAQLRQIIDLVPHMIFVKDWDGKYLLVNKAVAEANNMSVSDLTGKYHADLHSDSSELQKMLQDDRAVMMTGEMKFIPEESYTDAHGNLRFHQATKVPFHIFGNKKPAVLGVAIDITEHRQADGALRESEARLDLALRSAHMGVWSIDLIENKRHFDEQVCHLLGIDPAKFTGTAEEFYNAVHPEDREMLKAALARSIEQDVPYEKEYRVVWPDGSVHYIITRGKLFRDETGQPVRMNGLIWDNTERKRAEEEKAQLEAELQQAQKLEAIGTLAGGIAHDFNNILQPIIGYTDMALLELSPSSPLRKSLEQVLNASLRAKELIRQILAISRSTEEQQRIPIDISSIIKEALKLLRSSLPTSIEMRQKILKGVALADPTQIHQVLMNLCTNAAHAMADKGVLEVRLSPVDLSESDLADQLIFDLKPGQYLRLTVSDNGCGMDAKTREHIFDPYFTTKEVGKGTGLGLAVVNGIIKRHDGAVTVRSEPGKGTTFSVYIPRVEAQAQATMQVDDPLPRGSERILIVDDESNVMEMATSILERLGYKVTSQTDSVKALEVFRLSPDQFDLVITDYTMPNLTGIDFAKEVSRVRPDMPILLCTGFSEKITPDSVKEFGVVLLMKPYGMRQISEAIRKILDERKVG